MWKFPFLPALWILIAVPLLPQTQNERLSEEDPASLIGLSLTGLITRFGAPESVYPVRGLEEWQDDVVFIYGDVVLFILKDRVWQLGLKSIGQVRTGDSRSAVSAAFGEALYSGEDFAIYPFKGQNWPLALRFNFDSDGRVSSIFVYRSDI